METSGSSTVDECKSTTSKYGDLPLEAVPLKIFIKDSILQIDTVKYVMSLYPNFQLVDDPKDCDLFWSQKPIFNKLIRIILKNKFFINRYSGYDVMFNKAVQAEVYNQCKRIYPDDYKFWPTTYILPRDTELFSKVVEETESSGKIWIYKISESNQGSGATIFTTLKEFNETYSNKRESAVVQEYVSNPLLINNKKFDCRIYVIVAGVNPMKAYVTADFGLTK